MRTTHADPGRRPSPHRDPRLGVGLIALALGLGLVAAGLRTPEPIVAFESRQAPYRGETSIVTARPLVSWQLMAPADGRMQALDASTAWPGNSMLIDADAQAYVAARDWVRQQALLSPRGLSPDAWAAQSVSSPQSSPPGRGTSRLCTSGSAGNPGAPC